MTAKSTSSWLDKDNQNVLKCNADSATKYPFSILLIGHTTWSTMLSDSIVEYHENNNTTTIQVHKAIDVKSAISLLSNMYIDLVIILMDVRENDSLVNVEINLLSLEPALLCSKTILVNPKNDIKRKDMGISYENIECLKNKYNLLIIHGNIDDYLSRTFMVRRIMILSSKLNYKGLLNILEFNSTDE